VNDVPRFTAVIVTISDTGAAGGRTDLSGPAAEEFVAGLGGRLVARHLVPDDRALIAERLRSAALEERVDLVLTTGGTGLSPRDVTPEATRDVIEREAPGLAELMRRETSPLTPRAALSRGVCGLLGTTLIINLPGSPRGVRQCLEVLRPVLLHALDIASGRVGQHKPDGGETAR
jgi:molybdenum cofactor synthesis domain-containing protein